MRRRPTGTQDKEVVWATRWDRFLYNSDPNIHWYSIINSLIILLFLSGMVAVIMLRTLYNDISIYNDEDAKVRSAPSLRRHTMSDAPARDLTGRGSGQAHRARARTRSCRCLAAGLQEDQDEVTGWKLVHGDVFRPPKRGWFLAVMVGTGVQFLGAVLTTIRTWRAR